MRDLSLTYYLREEQHYSKSELLEELEFQNSDFDSLHYLLDNKFIEADKKGGFTFKYVGLIMIHKKILFVFPKYYTIDTLRSHDKLIQNKNFKEFITVIRVLRKTSKTMTPNDDFNLITDESGKNELIVADEIIKDYVSNGIYNKKEEVLEINGEGEINWNQTVDIIQPFFSKKRPIYPDLFTKKVSTEFSNIITQIHKWAIKYSLNKYGELLEYQIIFDEDSLENYFEIGELSFLISMLNKELREVFIDRKIRLIKLLISLLTNEYDKSIKNNTVCFGTNTFHVVWEEVCSCYFNNQKNDPTFKEIIPRPLWKRTGATKSPKIHTLNPDIIYGFKHEKLFFTIDAKYYSFKFNEINDDGLASISGNHPGVGDVTKQLLYEYAFQERFNHEFDHWYNILAFPSTISVSSILPNFEIFGTVQFDLGIFNDKKIWLISFDPGKLYDKYLGKSDKTENVMLKISKSIDSFKLQSKMQ